MIRMIVPVEILYFKLIVVDKPRQQPVVLLSDPVVVNGIARVESDLLLAIVPIVMPVPIGQREEHISLCVTNSFVPF